MLLLLAICAASYAAPVREHLSHELTDYELDYAPELMYNANSWDPDDAQEKEPSEDDTADEYSDADFDDFQHPYPGLRHELTDLWDPDDAQDTEPSGDDLEWDDDVAEINARKSRLKVEANALLSIAQKLIHELIDTVADDDDIDGFDNDFFGYDLPGVLQV